MNALRIVFDYVKASKRIRDLRTGREISHETLAKAINVSSQSLKDYEQAALSNGTTGKDRATKIAGMSVNTLYALARYFSVSTDYLLGFTEIKTRDITDAAICESTGLSEEVIESLRCYPNQVKGINELLSGGNPYLTTTLDYLAQYRHATKALDYFLSNLDGGIVQNKDQNKELEELRKNWELSYFDLIDHIRMIIAQITCFDQQRISFLSEIRAARSITFDNLPTVSEEIEWHEKKRQEEEKKWQAQS